MLMPYKITKVPGDDGILVHVAGRCMYFEHIKTEWMIKAHDMYNNMGVYVQDAYHFLTEDQREFIMTGILPNEWDALFADEGDDDDHPAW